MVHDYIIIIVALFIHQSLQAVGLEVLLALCFLCIHVSGVMDEKMINNINLTLRLRIAHVKAVRRLYSCEMHLVK